MNNDFTTNNAIIEIPLSFCQEALSENAIRVLDYLDGSYDLVLYKRQFVLTDESQDLSNPRWAGYSLVDLDKYLSEQCADMDANYKDYPGFISLNDPREWNM